MKNVMKILTKIFIVIFFAAMFSLLIFGCIDWKDIGTDKVCTEMTGIYVSKREGTSHSWTGKSYVTHHHYYVSIKTEDGVVTEFEDKPLYDEMSENSQITIYKIDRYKNDEYVDTKYSLSDTEGH